jgi:hypothetical protein
MLVPREQLRQYHENLVELLKHADKNDFVIVSGTQWAYGQNKHGNAGFYLRPWADPLAGVSVMPLKLAKRVKEFSGGHIVSVPIYLGRMLGQVQETLL